MQVYVCVGLPHKCCSCAFSRIHCTLIQSNMHLVQLLIHSCLHLRFDRFLSLWIAFLFAFPPVFPFISFFFILRTNRHFLCAIFDSRATATSATNVLIRLEFQLHLFAPFRIHSNSSLIITVKTKAEGAWQLLYASFKVTKCWFIEELDGKTNRNSLNFTWLNVLHKLFISFTQLPWHFVQAK